MCSIHQLSGGSLHSSLFINGESRCAGYTWVVRALPVLSNRNLIWINLSKGNVFAYWLQVRVEQLCGKSWGGAGHQWLLESGTEMLISCLCFSCTLPSFSCTGLQLSSLGSNVTTHGGQGLVASYIQHSRDSLPDPNGKNPGEEICCSC